MVMFPGGLTDGPVSLEFAALTFFIGPHHATPAIGTGRHRLSTRHPQKADRQPSLTLSGPSWCSIVYTVRPNISTMLRKLASRSFLSWSGSGRSPAQRWISLTLISAEVTLLSPR